MSRLIALAILCLAATPGQAGELSVMEAESVDLGGFHGVVYYTVEQDGYRVVATIGEGESGLPVRCEATLTDTQKLTISAPGNLGGQTHVLELRRAHGKLVVATPKPVTEELVTGAPNLGND